MVFFLELNFVNDKLVVSMERDEYLDIVNDYIELHKDEFKKFLGVVC